MNNKETALDKALTCILNIFIYVIALAFNVERQLVELFIIIQGLCAGIYLACYFSGVDPDDVDN